MRILMINKTDSLGGAAQVMQNLADGLRKKGHEVRCLVRRKFTDDKNVCELADGLIGSLLRKVSGRDVPIVITNFRDAILANDIDWGKSKEILNHPLVKWAEVIHCHNLHGNYFKLDNLVELSKTKKVVWTWHDWWPYTGHCATPMSCIRYESGCGSCPNLKTYQTFLWDNTSAMWIRKREILGKTNVKVVVPSMEMANKIVGSTLIYNGVNVDKMLKSKLELRKEFELPVDKKIIMFVAYGWKNVDKGWKLIEKMVEQQPDWFWLGVGASRSGKVDGVNYVSWVSQKELHKYMAAADVFLFPSLFESFGMSPVESMVHGTPVVGFPVGVTSELIDHKKNGYLAKYGDGDDLVNGIKYLLANKLTGVMPDFSIEKMVLNYEKVYETA